jgi:hypothetical protein
MAQATHCRDGGGGDLVSVNGPSLKVMQILLLVAEKNDVDRLVIHLLNDREEEARMLSVELCKKYGIRLSKCPECWGGLREQGDHCGAWCIE